MAPDDPRALALREAARRLLDDPTSTTLHNLSNALMGVSALLHLLRREASQQPGTTRALEAIDDAFGEAITLTRNLGERVYARRRGPEYPSVTRVVAEIATRFAPSLPQGISLSFKAPEPLFITLVPKQQLARMIVPLCESAALGMPHGGAIVLEVDEEPALPEAQAPSAWIVVRVRAGESLEVPPTLTQFARAFGGRLELRSAPEGVTAIVRLPAAR
jgi:signal transduction histidine kinase